MTTPGSPEQVQFSHINRQLDEIKNAIVQLTDLAKSVAILNERYEAHRDETRAMSTRINGEINDLVEEQERIKNGLGENIEALRAALHENNNEVHARISRMQKWVYTVSGGGLVVLAILGWVGDASKELLKEFVSLRDTSHEQARLIEDMRKRDNEDRNTYSH